jgi:CDP-diacylglycerol--glycerol-3-phosphate 3-phosphatidyltransferase
MLYQLKAQFQKFALRFSHSGLTAHHATFLGAVFVGLTMASFYWGFSTPKPKIWLLLTPFFLLFRLVMNALDGLLARAQGTASAAGEIMNELSDVLGDTLSYGILYFALPGAQTWIVVFLISLWCCEFIGVLGKSLPAGQRRQESVGGGKPERTVWMGMFAIISYFAPGWLDSADFFFAALSILVILSALYRAIRAVQAAKGQHYVSDPQLGR